MVQMIPVDQLHFDPENPRLPISLRAAPENEVFSFLLRECNLIELMLSIGSQGFFAGEPVLCAPNAERNLIVVEGNRRLAAVKLLLRNDPAPTHVKQVDAARSSATQRPNDLPVIIFPARGDIITYLGYRHITGVNQWGALEKARYLEQLAKRHGSNPDLFKILAREIGSRADYVAQTLTALAVIECANDQGIFSKYSISAEAIPFSILTTALSYSSLCTHIGLESRGDVEAKEINPERLEELFKWLFVEESGRTRLGESRNLRVLARVVTNDRAIAKFRAGATLEESDLFTEGPLILLQKTMIEVEHRLSVAQDALKSVDSVSPAEQDRARSIERAARALRASVDASVEG